MTVPAPEFLLYVDSKYISPYAMSAFVTLHEKGLPFDVLAIDLATGENHAASFAQTSLTSRVPTLVHEDCGSSWVLPRSSFRFPMGSRGIT